MNKDAVITFEELDDLNQWLSRKSAVIVDIKFQATWVVNNNRAEEGYYRTMYMVHYKEL